MSGRREIRRDTVLYFPVRERESGKEIGRLTDLTTSGALLISTRALPSESVIEATIDLPASVAAARQLPVLLTPRWARPDTRADLWRNGCLLEVAEEYQRILQGVIEKFAFHNGAIDLRLKFEEEQNNG